MTHKLHPVPAEWAARAWIDKKAYRSLAQSHPRLRPTEMLAATESIKA